MESIMLFRKLLLSTAIAACATAAVAADKAPQPYRVLGFGGGYTYDSDRNLEDDVALFGLGGGYAFDKNMSIEGAYSMFTTSQVDRDDKDYDMEGELFSLNGLYHFGEPDDIRPFVQVGLNYLGLEHEADDDDDTMLSIGGGVEKVFFDHIAVRGTIAALAGDSTDAMATIGLAYLFGGDKKPTDSDGDGVLDSQDKCPGTPAGEPVDSRGCELDDDKDGVFNRLDACPATPAGTKVDTKGCPLDSDNDGVADHLDQCPATPENAEVDKVGCPLDSDKDGVADHVDECANTPMGAKVDAKGCRIMLEQKVAIDVAITFASGSDKLTPQFYPEVIRVAKFMTLYPDTKVVIEGHTDSQGSAAFNQRLSERRAKSVANFLVKNGGIDASRVSSIGHGEAKPVADNSTAQGRKQNRRVVAVVETTVMVGQ
jgi:OOP family OmpA-OmpF porin